MADPAPSSRRLAHVTPSASQSRSTEVPAPARRRTPTAVVKRHYEAWFDWFDRGELARNDSGELEAPIMNIGYWKDERDDVRGAQVAMVNLLVSRMPGLAGARVLDAGCGVGGPAIILAR